MSCLIISINRQCSGICTAFIWDYNFFSNQSSNFTNPFFINK
ncbi:hypothetical protein CoNPh17_CDS0141 [Staphylococcus phage S-CoN_Ph17]|nr:hypothetical protein CoNPh17_CDS0141 [Staphylococcus phage S-CoN_Ph17]